MNMIASKMSYHVRIVRRYSVNCPKGRGVGGRKAMGAMPEWRFYELLDMR